MNFQKKTTAQNSTSGGFTLIELLVVISIIGLLSSVVLAAVSTARTKGMVAAGQSFDGHTYAAFYNNLLAAWDFDADVFPNVQDQSGNNYTLVITNPSEATYPSLITTVDPFNSGKTLTINNTTPKTATSLPLVASGGDYSISFWFRTTGIDAFEVISNTYGAAGTWKFDPHDQSSFWFDVKGTVGQASVSVPSPLSVNQWYQIVGVCSGSKIAMYIDGNQVGTSAAISLGGTCTLAGNPILIKGTPNGTASTYVYYMDNVRIYNKALPISYIEKNYLAELPHFKATELTLNSKHHE